MITFLMMILLCEYICGTNASQQFRKTVHDSYYENVLSDTGYPEPGDIPLLNRKVFKGKSVAIGEHPYIASIRRLYSHYSMGTILTKTTLVTVANPLINVPLTELGVVVGENYSDRGTRLLTVIVVIVHEDFDLYTLSFDIALVQLYEEITFGTSIKPVCLISPNYYLRGNTAFVTGWGRCDTTSHCIPHDLIVRRHNKKNNSQQGKEVCFPRASIYYPDEKIDPILRSVSFKISSPNSYCENYTRHDISLRRGMLCLGTAREENPMVPCLGVPGAPLVVQGSLAGLLSWGLGCGYKRDLPLIYTDIQHLQPWIVHNVPILRNITKEKFSDLFKAVRGYKLSQWLMETRFIKPIYESNKNYEIQKTKLDNILAALRGNVYDIRDFIDNGIYHYPKMEIYYKIRERNAMIKKLKSHENVNKSKPFLTEGVLNEVEIGKLPLQYTSSIEINNTKYDIAYEDVL